ncbi:hypothetical protein Tco_1103544 [Tanacetum coccineum]
MVQQWATKPKLDANLSGEPIDQTDYHSKIGSLMYLTSSRPDIVQAVCYCARYSTDRLKIPQEIDVMPVDVCNSQKAPSGGNTVPRTGDGDGDASFQLEWDSTTICPCLKYKTYYKHQDSRIMEAQEIKVRLQQQTLITISSFKDIKYIKGYCYQAFKDMQVGLVGQDTIDRQGGQTLKTKDKGFKDLCTLDEV